jgi:hypothetical protein
MMLREEIEVPNISCGLAWNQTRASAANNRLSHCTAALVR